MFIAVSLDGYIARADGSIDWLDAVGRPDEDYGFARFYAAVDALVMGRRTYETALGFPEWPYAGKRCIVLTHDPATARGTARHGEELHAGDVAALVERLGSEGVGRVYVDGGVVISQFLAAGLIDDLTVSVIPILLGSGARLFDRIPERTLTLVSSRAYESGLVQLEYKV